MKGTNISSIFNYKKFDYSFEENDYAIRPTRLFMKLRIFRFEGAVQKIESFDVKSLKIEHRCGIFLDLKILPKFDPNKMFTAIWKQPFGI